MDYEEKYKNALANARQEYSTTEDVERKQWLEELFPELTESEDERMRDALIRAFKSLNTIKVWNGIELNNIITWLEKQGEKPQGKSALEAIHKQRTDNANKVERKFKVGDWITDGKALLYITKFEENYGYELKAIDGKVFHFVSPDLVEANYHLWTIADVKEGDVLDANGAPFIYKKHDKDYVYFYCGINLTNEFIEANGIDTWNNNKKVYPATKEQRDLLFQKMKEAGYKWDSDIKKLKKIETIDIPFSAKDSELMEATYFIPEGFHAEIVDNKVIIKKDGQKPILSEEDNTKLRQIEYACMKFFGGDCSHINWLRKFTKPQTTWKPTEEQIQALNEAVGIVGMFTPRGSYLKSLSEQLKRL